MNSDASAASTPIPAETGAALKHLGWLLEQDLPDVRPNQIWRATWDKVTTTGVVLDTDDDDRIAEFAPFTVDTDYADPYTGIVTAFYNPIGVDLAVFAGLTTPIAMFTLDKWLGDLDPTATSCLHALWCANLAGLPPKDPSLETGTPDVDSADPRRDYRNTLRAETAHIQAADLQDQDAVVSDIDLPQRLTEASISPSDLVTDTVTLSYARQAAEGNTAIRTDLAVRIGELLGEPDPHIFESDGPPLPDALADCLTTPRRFSVVREIMASEELNEVAAARRIPAIVKFRRIDHEDGQTEHDFWERALDMLKPAR